MTHTHTTSLEHSKKLADACKKMQVEMPRGQFTVTRWKVKDTKYDVIIRYNTNPHFGTKTCFSYHCETDLYPSYCLGELMRMLPIEYIVQRRPHGSIGAKEYTWCASKYDEDAEISCDTPENAACELLTELILSGKVKTIEI